MVALCHLCRHHAVSWPVLNLRCYMVALCNLPPLVRVCTLASPTPDPTLTYLSPVSPPNDSYLSASSMQPLPLDLMNKEFVQHWPLIGRVRHL